MPRLILVRGLPGSGKSTYAKSLSIHHVEADMYFVNQQGTYQFNPDELQQAHRWCQEQTEHVLKEGRDVVVSNTFVERWEMNPYLNMASQLNANVEIVVCNGNFTSVHDVPSRTVKKMKFKWQD
ncbi:ATP-binding protein [Vibrio sp. S9_S30]|uniref:AAA family ATPase n=1 Tax=Vibrio sp. S9_S30 TaxID=2720226 RepID=UPI001680D3EC|nr:ATP-binding protein [Vibrio sp. S9_S30]